MSNQPRLIAYHTPGRNEIEIVPASRWRDWMEATVNRWANRCLPLLMANEHGWSLLNPHGFTATWSGEVSATSTEIELDDPLARGTAISIFGYGILTWTIPYVFRTDPGWNLLARGPANQPKDGVSPLEGLVETDWSTAVFTMNWKLTRAGLPVRFEPGEAFCTIVPLRRHDLEAFTPRKASLSEDEELEASYQLWERRREALAKLKFVGEYGVLQGVEPTSWQQDYFRGRTSGGESAPEHQTKQRLRPFSEAEANPTARANGAPAAGGGPPADDPAHADGLIPDLELPEVPLT